jgi:glucose-1-phosphate thymidylyltransferase
LIEECGLAIQTVRPVTTFKSRRCVGLIPAAGYATRLGTLPHSKEIHPIGTYVDPNGSGLRPKVVSHYLLEKMRYARIDRAYFLLRDGKWDIAAHFKDGAAVDMFLAYLLVTLPYGTPYTLDVAYPFVYDSLIALGFPDILFSPDDAYTRLIEHQVKGGADVVLGLFPTDQPQASDVVAIDDRGRILQILTKPKQTTLSHTWGIAVWTPTFTEFLHSYLASLPTPTNDTRELFVGDVVQAGIKSGMRVEGVPVSDTPFLDIGTPENLARAIGEATIFDGGRIRK